MTLKQLETEARRNGSATQMIDGTEFEIRRMGKPGSRRVNYRHGKRHMGRDEAERLLPFTYDPAKMFPFATSRHTMTD